MDELTLKQASEKFKIPKRTLQNACEAGHLKYEWRVSEVPYRVKYMVTTQAWISEWKASDKKRTRSKAKEE